MIPGYAVLAKKYATAFMDVAQDLFDEHDLKRVDELQKFLHDNRKILFFFNFSLIDQEVINAVLDKMFKNFKTESLFKKLMQLILHERRALLMPEVLYYVAALYREKNNIISFDVESAQELSEEEKKTVEQFLADSTKKNISPKYKIDSTLIAGMRAQSETLLWEHSIKNQLMMMRRSLIEQGALWN